MRKTGLYVIRNSDLNSTNMRCGWSQWKKEKISFLFQRNSCQHILSLSTVTCTHATWYGLFTIINVFMFFQWNPTEKDKISPEWGSVYPVFLDFSIIVLLNFTIIVVFLVILYSRVCFHEKEPTNVNVHPLLNEFIILNSVTQANQWTKSTKSVLM